MQILLPGELRKIREANDRLRVQFIGGLLVPTRRFRALKRDTKQRAIEKLRTYCDWDDPSEEHRYCCFEVDEKTICAKITYHLPGRSRPVCPRHPRTERVLTVGLLEDCL